MAKSQLETYFDKQWVMSLQCRYQGTCCHVSYVIASAENEKEAYTKVKLSRWYSPLPPIHPTRTDHQHISTPSSKKCTWCV